MAITGGAVTVTGTVSSALFIANMSKDARLLALLQEKARMVATLARSIFLSQSRGQSYRDPDPFRYADSFEVRLGPIVNGLPSYVVSNTDPDAVMVEFGTRAGGKTLILKYRPLGRAVDQMMAGGGFSA